MKLYHATTIDNKESILECGLMPQQTTKISSLDEHLRISENGVFGFTTLEDSLNFGRDNWCWDDVVVFEFEANDNDIIDDPEYDGEAKFVPTNDVITANLIYCEVE